MDNLPTDNQNNQPPIIKDNLEPENPPSPVTPEITDKTITNPEIISSETNPEIISNNTNIEEKPIEIGSIDSDKPSFSAYTQETNNLSSNSSTKKNKNGKIITSVIAILLIVVSLPISVLLVKQRQDIRKNASESQAAFSDITITFESETAPSSSNGGTYSTTFKVANTVSSTRTVTVEKKSCHCSSGSPSMCNDNCSATNATLTLGGNQSTNVTISANQPNGAVCGAFQTDLTVKSVN